MLANQVHLPEVNTATKSSQATENKGVEARESELDFEQLVQSKQRQQQEQQQRQNDAIERQDQKNKAADIEQQHRAEAKQSQEQKQSAASSERRDDSPSKHDKQPVNNKDTAPERSSEAKSSEPDEKADTVSEDASTKDDNAEQAETKPKLKQPNASANNEVDNSETSQWLDTILQIASSNSESTTTDVKLANTEAVKQHSMTAEDFAQVKQILQQLDIEIPDSLQVEQGQTLTLQQLTEALSPQELEKLTVAIQQHLEQLPAENTEVTKFLNNLMSDSSSTKSESDKDNSLAQLLQQLQAIQNKQASNNTEAVEVTNREDAKKGPIQLSNILNSLRQNNNGLNQQLDGGNNSLEETSEDVDTAFDLKQGMDKPETKAANINAPTTKVVDFGIPTSVINSGKLGQESTSASLANVHLNTIVEGQTSSEVKPNLELNVKELAEIKPSTLFSDLIDTKTSDMESRSAKVNVAGVTLDKTLQMPKLENLAQAKNEVVVRENILFNKQELANQMQTQVGLMMARNMKSVDIRLDPPELGSMQVRLSVQNDQASVSFVVSSNQAKDALEQSLPKLKEMLEQQGMQLADSDVQHGDGQRQEQAEEEGVKANGLSANGEPVEDDLESQQQRINQQINSPWNVSYYA
jgi:flagellar hook-length control protein FliK